MPGEHRTQFGDDADAVVADQRKCEASGAGRLRRQVRRLDHDSQFGHRGEGSEQPVGLFLRNVDAHDACELSGEMCQRRFEPVAVAFADGRRERADESGAVVADDGKHEGSGHGRRG